jgi:hypothetical protein
MQKEPAPNDIRPKRRIFTLRERQLAACWDYETQHEPIDDMEKVGPRDWRRDWVEIN